MKMKLIIEDKGKTHELISNDATIEIGFTIKCPDLPITTKPKELVSIQAWDVKCKMESATYTVMKKNPWWKFWKRF